MSTCHRYAQGLVAVLLSVWAGALAGCGDSQAVVPAEYETYDAVDGSFAIDCPVGWDLKEGRGAGNAWATFTSGSAEIAVRTNLAGSLLGDMTASQNQVLGPQGKDPAREPVAVVHSSEAAEFAESEGAAEKEPTIIKTGLGEGRKSEFTATPQFGPAIHGYRATALGRDRRVRIVCKCPEPEWQTLQPIFDEIITSVGRGSPRF